MKRFISRAVAVILTCVLAFGSAVCFAADSTESADAKKYYDYGTYVLLGDSVASGHNDLVYMWIWSSSALKIHTARMLPMLSE